MAGSASQAASSTAPTGGYPMLRRSRVAATATAAHSKPYRLRAPNSEAADHLFRTVT